MKSRFSTIDIKSIVKELQRFLGMRVLNVYDVDNKTYLIRIARPDEKGVILVESGTRLHSTAFDWPKNAAPSGFSMKLRKHLKGRRLEHVDQLGVDRIVDLQFGSGEAAYHVLVEMYDRGNIVLTDFQYTILNILRPRTDDSQDVRLAVRETYLINTAIEYEHITEESVLELLVKSKDGDILKKILVSQLAFGPAIVEHCLLMAGFTENVKIGNGFTIAANLQQLMGALKQAETLFFQLSSQPNKGYVIQRREKRANVKDGESPDLLTYDEFHPYLFQQYMKRPYLEFDTFAKAVDEFYSQLESQKLDLKVVQQEKSALKKLENVRKDHDKRILVLKTEQELDIKKGELIELNLQLVDHAISIVRSALANQIDWTEIWSLVKEAQLQGDPVAMTIKGLKLDTNHITLLLRNPYLEHCEAIDLDEVDRPQKVDVDLALSAYANSKRFFDKKKHAAQKEQKTVDASSKALKSAERKTKQTLKDVATAATINKARKTFWFEKFLWFISSENYMVIGGRDQQQNEFIVKRYFRAGDLYVHADLHGASSVIIKNPTGEPVPPKTLNEAGTMALCHSAAWDAKVVTSAWWVHHDQVSKTAPTGEYLTTGSFMVRGKKNYLPPSHLIYGFGLLFRLEEGSIFRHTGERKIRSSDDDDEISISDSMATESEFTSETLSDVAEEEVEDVVGDGQEFSDSDSDDDDDNSQASQEDNNHHHDDEKQQQLANNDGNGPNKAMDTAKTNDEMGENTEDDEDDDNLFPDTTISLKPLTAEKFSLQRVTSVTSTSSRTSAPEIEEGDCETDLPSGMSDDAVTVSTGRLSAKQRRELKKHRKGHVQQALDPQVHQPVPQVSPELQCSTPLLSESQQTPISQTSLPDGDGIPDRTEQKQHQPQQQLKRGQKSKLKKIRDKYADQDEEERQLRLEILASSGPQKPDKKAKKGKDGKTKGVKSGQPQQQQKQVKGKPTLQPLKPEAGDLILQPEAVDLKLQDSTVKIENTNQDSLKTGVDSSAANSKDIKPEQGAVSDDDEHQDEETQQQTDDNQVMDSLTGCPVTEDELLFAIPVCAPYQTMHNYKFKIKLLPGSTKRGKAAKSALNMFLHDKAIVAREKDLLRMLKDVDLSRHIPGKVKLAAANLQKQKKRK